MKESWHFWITRTSVWTSEKCLCVSKMCTIIVTHAGGYHHRVGTAFSCISEFVCVCLSLRWVEQGLTSHQTHYTGHIGDGFLWIKWPNQQCQSTEGSLFLKTRLQSHQVHPTVLTIIQQLCGVQKTHKIQTQINLCTVKCLRHTLERLRSEQRSPPIDRATASLIYR